MLAKNNRNLSIIYPEERYGKTKDANKKLKAQIKRQGKRIKQLESEIQTLSRAFQKSCDFIQQKLKNRKLSEIIEMINNYGYKETEKGRQKEKEDNFIVENCPDCGKTKDKGFSIMNFSTFTLVKCECGYKNRKRSEGDQSN